MDEQVTPQRIIYGLIDAMRASLKSLWLPALAPGFFRISLRQPDYERIEGSLPNIIESAHRALDSELDRLNRDISETGRPGLLSRLKRGKTEKAFFKPYTGWDIRFSVDEHLAEGQPYRIDIAPDAQTQTGLTLDEESPASASESEPAPDTPDNAALLQAETEASDSFKPQSPSQLAVTLPSNAAPVTLQTQPEGAPPENAYAEISFTDERGPQFYYMTKPRIVVGRGGREYWVDLKLQTVPDVSHEHLRIRYDEHNRRFLLKDLSTYGTTINGVLVASSLEQKGSGKRDIDLWVDLPAEARLGLAEVLFLDFKSLKG